MNCRLLPPATHCAAKGLMREEGGRRAECV